MFVVWGTKIKRARLGWVADFCPICRDARPFQLRKVSSVGHLYYISFGSGNLLGYERTCGDCGITLNADAHRYASLTPSTDQDLDSLIAATNPQFAAQNAARLDLEERLEARKLTPEERVALIREPLVLVSPSVEHRAAQTQFDGQSGLGGLATLALPALILIIASATAGQLPEWAGLTALALAILGGLFTLYSLATDSRRFIRREVNPRLLRALRPIEPTLEELESVIQQLRTIKHPIGRRINPRRLFEDLQHSSLTAAHDVSRV